MKPLNKTPIISKELNQNIPCITIGLKNQYDETINAKKIAKHLNLPHYYTLEKHPIMLPPNHHVVKLLVQHIHITQLHAGINHTLVTLRNRFWVIKARSLVRTIVKSCLLCRMYMPTRIKVPMCPLPKDRITRAAPFSVIGVDFTGPVYSVMSKERILQNHT